MSQLLRIFIACELDDKQAFDDLMKHLMQLVEKNIIAVSSRFSVQPGQSLAQQLEYDLYAADVIVLLVSVSLINSSLDQVNKAVVSGRNRSVKLLPVLIEHVILTPSALGGVQFFAGTADEPVPLCGRSVVWTKLAAEILKLSGTSQAVLPALPKWRVLNGGAMLGLPRAAGQALVASKGLGLYGMLMTVGLAIISYCYWDAKRAGLLVDFARCMREQHNGYVELSIGTRQGFLSCTLSHGSALIPNLKQDCNTGIWESCHYLGHLLVASQDDILVKEGKASLDKACNNDKQQWRACLELANLAPKGSQESCHAYAQAAQYNIYGAAVMAAHFCVSTAEQEEIEDRACTQGITFACTNLAAKRKGPERYKLYEKACKQLEQRKGDRICTEPGCIEAGVKACLWFGDHMLRCSSCSSVRFTSPLCSSFLTAEDWNAKAKQAYRIACNHQDSEACRAEERMLFRGVANKSP